MKQKRNSIKQQNPYESFPDKFFIVEDKNELFHEKTFIGTKLGGEGNRFRNYVVISTKSDIPLSTKERKILNETFEKICQKYDSLIEAIAFFETYALMKLLVSMDVAIGDIIDEGIIACNKQENFLRFHYYVTNVKKPTAKEIQKYLQLDEVKHAE